MAVLLLLLLELRLFPLCQGLCLILMNLQLPWVDT
jgi:hypothetical protein